MTVYQKDRYQPIKWLLAIIVFILAMTFTLEEAEGFNLPKSMQSQVTTVNQTTDKFAIEEFDYINSGISEIGANTYSDSQQPVTPVPEPSTIIILAIGIGALRVVRKVRNATR